MYNSMYTQLRLINILTMIYLLSPLPHVRVLILYFYIPIKVTLNAGRSDTNEVISMVILVIIGLALAPTVQSTVDDANLNGTMGTIGDIVPILYIVAILALTASYVYVKQRG